MTSVRWRKIRLLVLPYVVAVLLLVLWEALNRLTQISSVILPAPSTIFSALIRYREVIAENALHTFITAMIGFALGVVTGVVIGFATGISPAIYSSVYPLLVAFNAIPKVALLPLFVLWAGIGVVPAVLTALTLAFFPIAVNVATGLATIDPEMNDLMRSLGARRDEILVKVGIPRAMPFLFASLKIAISLAFVGTVISETVASNDGIGFLMMSASSSFNVPLVFAGVFVIAVMAVAAYGVCSLVEQRMIHWAFRAHG
ncbi:MAG TPA: ABC transporter permease [Xanthobacteraceae bacterium]